MKHVNGDMDDLFRRASEKYPLRTDSADWDRLASALEKAPDSPSDPEAADERRRRGVFWWFLLIPLGGLGYFTWQATTHAHPAAPVVVTRAAAEGADAKGGAAGAEAKGTAATAEGKGIDAKSAAVGTETKGGASGAGVAGGTAAKGTDAANAESAGASPAVAAKSGDDAAATNSRANGMPASRIRANAGQHHRVRGATVPSSPDRFSGPGAGVAQDGNDVSGKTGAATAANMVPGAGFNQSGKDRPGKDQSGKDRQLLSSHLDLHRVPTAGNYSLMVNVKAPPVPADSSSNKKKTTASATKKSAHAYVGILGAPDLSTVHFQSMKGVGTTFGILLGYSFNDRWAVESGVYLDRKRYYTEGEYFSKEGVRTYPNTNLLNVDGTCYMWEIPINLRYNFNTSPRMKWFATAGLSTYLMTKENYSYQYQYTWGGSVEDGSWNLKKPSQYWFSIVNISAGFEQRLGKIGNLRLEPYLRLPLSGIGTGKLPILSAGLNIGITRQLW